MEIGLLLFPKTTQLDLTAPQEVFSRIPGATVRLIAADRAPVASDRGLRLLPDLVREESPRLDLLFVPGGAGVNDLIQDDRWLDFIAHQGSRASWVASACTGSLALGAAGLLRGHRATTHWLYLPLLELVGAVPTPERVVQDRNRFTGGGVTAGIDLALTVAADVAGRACAETIQLALEYDPAPPFRSGHPREADPELVRRLSEAAEERRYFQHRRAIIQDAVKRRAQGRGSRRMDGH